jgi:hypothetical protein
LAPPGTRGAEAAAVIHATIAGGYITEREREVWERERKDGAKKGF